MSLASKALAVTAVWLMMCASALPQEGVDLGKRPRPLRMLFLTWPAWKAAAEELAELKLYEPDGSHPSTAGAYVNACAFYSVF